MTSMTRTSTLLICLLLGACTTKPEKADAFIVEDADFASDPWLEEVALYLPNRLIDLLDVVHIGYATGYGLGLELHPTRHARIGATASISAGVAWLSRHTNPFEAAVYARTVLGEDQSPPFEDHADKILWRFPRWDVGLLVVPAIYHVYVAIAPDEIVDFLLGFSTYDAKGDDF